jgi:SAM-dependent methyltransferase
VSELWRVADEATERFSAQALDYDRYRPRYPESAFDDIVLSAGLGVGDRVIEIGSGTGIATKPLADRGLSVTAIEPSSTLASVAESKTDNRVRFVISRFEECSTESPARLVAAFNAWHWVEQPVGTGLAAELLQPGGSLALVWTEVVQWGQQPFEDRLAEVFGRVWNKQEDHVVGSLRPVQRDPRFGELDIHHHRFERTLDAATFVAVTRTYGGSHTTEQYRAIEQIINHEFGGAITKVENATVYLARRQ